jgi:archaellum biogenesis protein FlaJ (TadC family)
MEILLLYSLVGVLIINAALLLAVNAIIPSDKLFNPLDKNDAQKKIRMWLYLSISIGAVFL